jgi:acetylornithine aminotransferase
MLTFSQSYLAAFGKSGNFKNDDSWLKFDFLKCMDCQKSECSASCEFLKGIDFRNVSAFVLEPGSTHGRVIFPQPKLVTTLAKTVKASGGLVVVDEVTTGFGRTGKWFGYNHYEVQPDIVALGKALGNGYPVSAVLMNGEIAGSLEDSNFRYAQSHQNDPLGCAVAKEVLKIFEESDLIERSRVIGGIFLNMLKMTTENVPVVKDVRGRGLMLALELHNEGIVDEISAKLLQKGYIIGVTPAANILRFYPALIIEEKDIMEMCAELKNVLKSY